MFALTSSKARSFAETRWGRGGTRSYRTNRFGAFYYSCSSHGGYVVAGYTLSAAERANIDKHVAPEKCTWVYDTSTGKTTFLSNPNNMRAQRYRFNPDRQAREFNYPVYYFEEDCDWAVLEKFTDIRRNVWNNEDPDAHEKFIEQVFSRWVENRA